MPVLFSNNASATLASAITAAATTITVTTGQGARFPAASGSNIFYATLVDSSNNLEIVRVTARSGDSLTVVRAQEGTTARAYNAADRIELRATAAGLANMAQLDAAQTFSAAQTFGSTTSFTGVATFSQTIAGSINGNAATVTNGVYTSGNQTIAGVKTFSDIPVFTNSITISGVAPLLTMIESDQTLPAGRRRIVQDGNSFTLRRNTAAGGDFSTEVNDITSDSSGNFTASGNVTAYSDERLKKDWSDLPHLVDSLALVKMGTYTRVDTGDRQVGVSAQSLEQVLPEAVLEDVAGVKSVAYGNAALAACVALAREVQALRARVEELEGR